MADEYIKREDAVALLSCFTEIDPLGNTPKVIAEHLPAADVRPVVFCKDCKYFHKESGKCLNIDGMAKQLDSADFCSCGADMREEDDGD